MALSLMLYLTFGYVTIIIFSASVLCINLAVKLMVLIYYKKFGEH